MLTFSSYADDFLHHTKDAAMYKRFQQNFTKQFEVKSGGGRNCLFRITKVFRNISFAVSELCCFVSSPGHSHMAAVKHLTLYLKGSQELGLTYSKPSNSRPMNQPDIFWGFVDLDWAGCPDSSRSTTGFTLMLNGAAVAWKSKQQSVAVLSSAEAEFMAALALVQEVDLCLMFAGVGFSQPDPTCIYEVGDSIKQVEESATVPSRAEELTPVLNRVEELVSMSSRAEVSVTALSQAGESAPVSNRAEKLATVSSWAEDPAPVSSRAEESTTVSS